MSERCEKPYAYIAKAYGTQFEPGMHVRHTVTGGSGIVRREAESHGHYVRVAFEGRRHSVFCHPGELAIILRPKPKDKTDE